MDNKQEPCSRPMSILKKNCSKYQEKKLVIKQWENAKVLV